ncbi:MAG: hypothetical protein IAA81_00370 [Spirochaetes bacterium]|uniref:Uncharacterized protein n=1 Tax=Candidatus Gallitreponema excrementavium TaxID=2840840 RepID=A0A9D9HMP6_9SPIR|nr:hypothetical protein [Candidatus Gallitreponema excrementavium]
MKVNFCILVLGFICSAVMSNDKFIPIPPLNSFGVNSGYSGMPQAPEPPAVPVDGSGAYKVPEFKMTESVSKKSNTKTEQKKSDVNEGLVAAGILSSTGSLSGASSYLDTLLKNSYGNISGTDGNAGEKALLEEILKTLNSLENNKTENPGSRESAQDVKSSLPEILRLSAPGYDILTGCSLIISSSLSEKGDFLVTGDRTYNAGLNLDLTETFYMLFTKISDEIYQVDFQVTQSMENPGSFFYRAAENPPMVAKKTGNLLAVTGASNPLKLDILVRLP